MAIINARSPYYVSITNAAISYATLDISIWSGSSATVATENTSYSLKKYIQGTLTKVSFEISQLVRDDLDVNFDGNYTTSAESDGGAKWVKTTIKAFNSSNAQVGSTVTETNIAFDGYGYFEEGSSFTMANDSLFASEGDIFLPKFGDSNIAIYTGNNPTVLLKDIAGATVDTSTFPSSVQSSQQIKYVSLYPELITNFAFDDDSDWTKQSNDVIEDGLFYFGGQSGARYPNTFAPVVGTNYILNFTITEVNSGFLNGVFEANNPAGINITGRIDKVGDYSFQYTQTSTSNNLVSFFSASGFDGAMDNVSVKEVYDVSKISVEVSETINNYKNRVISDGGTFENNICLYSNLNLNNITTNANVKQVEECKFKPHKVTFVNKNGVLDDMYFFKKSTDSMTTKRESYNANTIKSDNTYSVNQHNKREFNITANSMVNLSSGYLNESSNEKFKQLLLSEKVWITRTFKNDELVLPINIKTSSISYKTSLNDKLVDYTIEFKDSYNAINNIR